MQYFFDENQLKRMENGLKATIAIPFIDDIEDYVVESILEYAKEIDGVDPFMNTRSKLLYDVVDTPKSIGYSVKSLKWSFKENDKAEFELVIQRSDIFKKAEKLGFGHLDIDSDPTILGSALLKHWRKKVEEDAETQKVSSKRIFVLLKSQKPRKKKNKVNDIRKYAFFEEDIKLYAENELSWKWTDETKTGLQGIRNEDQMCVYRWYPNQKQFFERFKLPSNIQKIEINPVRLEKGQIVDILLPCLQERR